MYELITRQTQAHKGTVYHAVVIHKFWAVINELTQAIYKVLACLLYCKGDINYGCNEMLSTILYFASPVIMMYTEF